MQKGEASKDTIFNVSLLIALVVALGPTLPLIVIWLVIRGPLARERRAIGRALDANDDALEAYLALRAATRFPYTRIAPVTRDPWGDLRSGRHAASRRWNSRGSGSRGAPPGRPPPACPLPR